MCLPKKYPNHASLIHNYLWGLVLLLLLSTSSCDQCRPEPVNSDILRLSFYTDSTFSESIALYFDTVRSANTYIPIDAATPYSTFELPLPIDTDSVQYVFKAGELTFTLPILYQRKVMVNPPDCGYYHLFHGIKLGEHSIMAARVTKNSIGEDDSNHIQLALRLPCNTDTVITSQIRLGFFSDTSFLHAQSVAFDSIKITNTDSLLYASTQLSLAALPLVKDQSALLYTFHTATSIDSLVVRYTPSLYAIAPKCGFLFHGENLRVVSHTFDSLYVANDSITEIPNSHIYVHF